MNENYNDYPEDFFARDKVFLKIAGMWYPDHNLSKIKRCMFWGYNFLCMFYAEVLYTILELAMIKSTSKNMTTLIEHVGMLLTHWLGILKLCMWHYNQQDIRFIFNFLHDDKYRYESYGDFKPGEIMMKNKNMSKLSSTWLFILACGVPTSKLLASYDYFGIDEEAFKNMTCVKFLPYYSMIPFPTSTKFGCGWAIIFQYFPMSIYAWQISAHDALFASILNCIKAHFLTLQGAFTTIRPRCIQRLGIKEDDHLHDAYDPILEQEMYLEMKKATVHLQQLIALRNKFESIFTYITLVQVLITLFVTVTCLFMVSTVPLFSGNFAAQFEYFMAIMAQFTFYSWFGNEITLASSGLLQALYNGEWLSSSRRFKKCMIINMIRIQRPFNITIGKFSPLTLSTFVTILRGSYSYYAVLNNKKDHFVH